MEPAAGMPWVGMLQLFVNFVAVITLKRSIFHDEKAHDSIGDGTLLPSCWRKGA
jgi:hypothetical protein